MVGFLSSESSEMSFGLSSPLGFYDLEILFYPESDSVAVGSCDGKSDHVLGLLLSHCDVLHCTDVLLL